MTIHDKAATLRALHEAPEILRVVNVWDAISARVVGDLFETKALATAGHSIAASHGYEDGKLPLDLTIAALERIVATTDLPVTADLDDGYGAPAETVRRAIGAGVVGANVEDRLVPLSEAVATVEAIIAAGHAEGIDFVLNARTDAFVLGGDRPEEVIIADAIERGHAYLEAGATTVFVPGAITPAIAEALVAGLGPQKLSVLGFPGLPTASQYEALGVGRISYGPLSQRVALTALHNLALDIYGEGGVPSSTLPLN
ncbi:isocitrate lyase/phosphoenolpyruvate mutase family protein [Klugiella xanthotipulae]|uniref:2-methylisocitrate lyase-like PEP mutase family enzyme n=1 Tax=Klugiella xanthotipulae TaxID=244735 RepID=A0A543I789_9MICO|nr:isocitrate lyase/phosphoenolpyruvate mutase family protein [Klugiella xanthotipulae]TQM66409.1 2-methylisocitrate lyase-like PEP mutase family enzyme [Klugiella xanthotipulae]